MFKDADLLYVTPDPLSEKELLSDFFDVVGSGYDPIEKVLLQIEYFAKHKHRQPRYQLRVYEQNNYLHTWLHWNDVLM